MPESNGRKIPHLDGWRGLAILAVLAEHFGLRTSLNLGGFGVLLFFVLSGYFMSQLLFLQRLDIPTFFARRFSRVIPTFWLFTGVMAVYSSTLQPVPYAVPLAELASTLTFLRTYLPAQDSIWSNEWPIGHFWSLNVEEHSYVYLALGALICVRVKQKIPFHAFLLGSTLMVLAITVLYGLLHPVLGASPNQLRSECAPLGLLAAATYRVWRVKFPGWLTKSRPYFPLVAFALAALCFSHRAPGALERTLAPLLLAYSVNHLDDVSAFIKNLLSNSLLRWFGTCSFSIYLWQQPFYHLVKSGALSPLTGLGFAILVGAVSFHFFENPVRLYLNGQWRARNGNPAIASLPPSATE